MILNEKDRSSDLIKLYVNTLTVFNLFLRKLLFTLISSIYILIMLFALGLRRKEILKIMQIEEYFRSGKYNLIRTPGKHNRATTFGFR